MTAINSLRIPKASFGQEAVKRFTAFIKSQDGGRGPGHNDQLQIIRQLRPVGPVELPQIPLNPVAGYCLARLARYGETNSASLSRLPKAIHDEGASNAFFPAPVRAQVIPALGKALFPGKRMLAWHNGLVTSSVMLISVYGPFVYGGG